MKAIRVNEFGGAEVLKLEETPDLKPGPGQVLVRVKAAGVNPVDTYIRTGTYGARKPALPFTPGMDGAGIVESVGTGVTRVKAGDRVYLADSISGTYAELALCSEAQAHALPGKVSFAQGAAVWVPYATAYRALFQMAHAKAGETVLVHGASGGVGVAAVQIARAAGLRVIGTGGTDKGRKLVLEQGAHYAVDHRGGDYLAEVLVHTGGQGVNVILEMLANVNLGKVLPILARNGRVVVIGSRGPVEINPRDLMGRDARIVGMSLLTAPPEDAAGIRSALAAGMENGTLRPVVGREMPLADAAKAHTAIMEGGALGKIVLIP